MQVTDKGVVFEKGDVINVPLLQQVIGRHGGTAMSLPLVLKVDGDELPLKGLTITDTQVELISE